MLEEHIILLTLAVLAVAILYSSVGHAGASGYIAVMSLFGIAPATIKPVALFLNVLVSVLAWWQFRRAGHFSWQLFWPFALLSVPCAFLGGFLNLPAPIFRVLVGCVLLFSAVYLVVRVTGTADRLVAPRRAVAIGVGAGIGLLSGLTGTGGGVFLSPLIVVRRWGRTTAAAGVSAPFILVNSVAGLFGNLSATRELPELALPLAVAAICGGAAGSYLGSQHLPEGGIRRLLAVVVAIAGLKLVFEGW